MYFPYLRARQAELLAVQNSRSLSDLTVPIFEPVNESSRTCGWWRGAIDKGRRFAIIVNSAHGTQAVPRTKWIVGAMKELPEERVYPAIEIRRDTDDVLLRQFASEFLGRTCVVVHTGHPLSVHRLSTCLGPLGHGIIHVLLEGATPEDSVRQLPGQAYVLLRDGFKGRSPNDRYPPESPFDNLVYTFGKEGFDGFGDFTTVGSVFVEPQPGIKLATLAYHLTEAMPPKMVTKHFLSGSSSDPGDRQNQYTDVRDQIMEYARVKGIDTQGIRGFRERERFPAYEVPKRLSILHHFEIIEREMARMGLTSFL